MWRAWWRKPERRTSRKMGSAPSNVRVRQVQIANADRRANRGDGPPRPSLVVPYRFEEPAVNDVQEE